MGCFGLWRASCFRFRDWGVGFRVWGGSRQLNPFHGLYGMLSMQLCLRRRCLWDGGDMMAPVFRVSTYIQTSVITK